MSKTLPIFLLAAVLCLGCGAALAQDRNAGPSPVISDNLPDLGYVVLRGRTPDPKCPGFSLTHAVAYPFGTGAPALDDALSSEANDKILSLSKFSVQYDDNTCPDPSDLGDASEVLGTFVASSPSADYVSILRTDFVSTAGAAHPSTDYSARSYKVSEARQLDLRDVFPDLDASLPKLWARLVADWCSTYESGTIPSYYNVEDAHTCSSKNVPPPESFSGANPPLTAVGFALLTPEGLTLNLGEYGGQSRVDGNPDLRLPKDFLIGIGARAEIWQ
ncbi:MAG: hypothetical protein LBP95_04155 [Deltaproteobacteria bacterium]|nr:hypothetical protein [Deltaproteobacteria bacterium]